MKVTWQQNSDNLDNADNLAAIAQWWNNLNGQEISWQQRLISSTDNVEELNWETQKFDEKFPIQFTQLRGITVYWQKNNTQDERNITARKLELDKYKQKLYIYPQSQETVVICVSLPQVVYQTIELNNPQIIGKAIGDNYLLLLRDAEQKLDMKVSFNSEKLAELLAILNKN
ncbi:MAG: hypothetical protein QNJ34_18945 [Xenococcaceae cyanobacterium MO_188.B29]|nr:hypothetical protein [Xenococcaceae cyanobacterium MO_188.B29]